MSTESAVNHSGKAKHHPRSKEHIVFPDGSERTQRTFRRIKDRILSDYSPAAKLERCGEEIRMALAHDGHDGSEWDRIRDWGEVIHGRIPDKATLGLFILIALQVVCDNRGKGASIESLVIEIKRGKTLHGIIFPA